MDTRAALRGANHDDYGGLVTRSINPDYVAVAPASESSAVCPGGPSAWSPMWAGGYSVESRELPGYVASGLKKREPLTGGEPSSFAAEWQYGCIARPFCQGLNSERQ